MPTRSEDTIIFNGLTPDLTLKKKTTTNEVYDAIKHFCDVKKEIDASDRFNVVIFQEEGPNYLQDFTLNPEYILIALKSLEPTLVRANIAGGIFVAITFIIDVYKRISEKVFRLIILTDSGSKKIPHNYLPILENLIEKVKDMPFFIDVVRLNVDDPEEDEKLMNLANQCYGNIHELNDITELSSIMEVLALKRQINPDSSFESKKRIISNENQQFYENLAEKPKVVSESNSACSICFENDKKQKVQCPRCKTIAHSSCWAQWAESSNIGMNHVFRCHNCFNLIKLEKKFVEEIQYGKFVTKPKLEFKSVTIEDYQENLEDDEGPKLVQMDDPIPFPVNESGMTTEKIEEYQKQPPQVEESEEEKPLKMIWCTSCNKMITNRYKYCPNCGHPVQ